MARLTVFLLLAALAVAAPASATQSQCKSEFQRLDLKPCENYMALVMDRMSTKSEGESSVLRMRGIRRSNSNPPEQVWVTEEKLKQWCCEELENLEKKPECMCQAQQQLMQKQRPKLKDQEMVPLLEGQVWYLPLSCDLRPPYGCDIAGTQ